MQTSTPAARISTAAHSNRVKKTLVANQLVLDSRRLRDWVKTASGPAWALPTTAFSIVNDVNGDQIAKGAAKWDYGYQNLGVQTPVTLPDGTTHVCMVSSANINANEDLVCFYSNSFRSNIPYPFTDDGIYVMRVFDDGAGHIHWGQAVEVTKHAKDVVNGTQFFISFPRLQVINSEYWILALECSLYAGVITYHLCYFRSVDGVVWSDRDYLAGVSTDPNEANVGINSYDNGGPTAFVKSDLQDAYLSVSGNNTYLVANPAPLYNAPLNYNAAIPYNGSAVASNFVCPSTSLVGITNPAKQLDITANVQTRSLSLPRVPAVGQGHYLLQNPGGVYNNQPLLDATSEDIRLLHLEGYHTPDTGSGEHDDLITVAVEALDQPEQTTELGKNQIALKTQDLAYTLNAPYYESDRYWEWNGPKQIALEQFCDLTALNVQANSLFSTNAAGELACGNTDVNSVIPGDVAFLLQTVTSDVALLEGRFRVDGSWAGTWLMASAPGLILQAKDGFSFWAVLYDGVNQKFELVYAIPSAPNRGNIWHFHAMPAQSGTIALSLGTAYWMRAAQWHNHIIAWYSTDHINWTKVIDYANTTVDDGGYPNVPTKRAYVGLAGHSQGTFGKLLGNVNAAGGLQSLNNGGNPYTVAIKIIPANASVLRRLAVVAAQKGNPGAATLGLAVDAGGGANPANLTVADNIIFSVTMPSIEFNTTDVPGWVYASVPGQIPLTASTPYWIFITFQGTLTGSQDWQAATQDPANVTYPADYTRISSDGGVTWAHLPNTNMDLTAYAGVDETVSTTSWLKLHWSSGEMPLTLERLMQHIVAKPGILTSVMDNLPGSALVGDCLISTDANLTGTCNITWRGANGYKVELVPSTQKVNFYANNVLSTAIDSLVYIPTGLVLHLTVVGWNGFLYLYVNDCLAACHYDNSITATGVVGNGGSATFTNFRVPDLGGLYEYFVMNDGETPQAAMQTLTGQAHSKHKPQRVKWFINYQGALRALSGDNPTVVDTYNSATTALRIFGRTLTRRWSIGQWIPQGNYYATHFFAAILKLVGRRAKHAQYATGSSDAQAYADAVNVSRDAQEQAEQVTLEAIANFAIEREDVNTLVDARTGVNGNYWVNDVEFVSNVEKAESHMTVHYRKVVS